MIVRLIKLAGSFKNILSTMITVDQTKDFVILHPILQSVGKSVGQTEYLVRKSAQLYLLCESEVSFETEVSQPRVWPVNPLGCVCSLHIECRDTLLRTIE